MVNKYIVLIVVLGVSVLIMLNAGIKELNRKILYLEKQIIKLTHVLNDVRHAYIELSIEVTNLNKKVEGLDEGCCTLFKGADRSILAAMNALLKVEKAQDYLLINYDECRRLYEKLNGGQNNEN